MSVIPALAYPLGNITWVMIMKAAWIEEFGAAGQVFKIGEQAKPSPQAGEVLVRLKTSCVNPSDVKKRAGAFNNLLNDGLVIPHSDGAGIIEAVGIGVDSARIGQRVFVYQAQYHRHLGTAAQYVCINEKRAPLLPEPASFQVGACLGIPAMTAHRCVFADGDVSGQTILITGGAGRVGYYAIQWARFAGATVIATASNARDEQACRQAGAQHVVNHRENNWGARVVLINGGERVQRVIDVEFGANLPQVLHCIDTGGTIATYSSNQVSEPSLPFRDMLFMDLTIRMVLVYAMPEVAKQQAIKDMQTLLAQDGLQHRIGAIMSIENIAHAHQLVEAGDVRGCVVLDIE